MTDFRDFSNAFLTASFLSTIKLVQSYDVANIDRIIKVNKDYKMRHCCLLLPAPVTSSISVLYLSSSVLDSAETPPGTTVILLG
jgi:hypothetical protein